MKTNLICILLFVLFSPFSFAQSTWTALPNPQTNLQVYIGEGYYPDPRLFLRSGQHTLKFSTVKEGNVATGGIKTLDIKYDTNPFQSIYNGSLPGLNEVTVPLDWSKLTVGEHIIRIEGIMNVPYLGQKVFSYQYVVHVVPAAQAVYQDNVGNRLILWQGGANLLDKPLVISEGFDPKDLTNPAAEDYPEFFYWTANTLFSTMLSKGVDIAIINYHDGGISLTDNAFYLQNAIRYLNQQKTSTWPTRLIGISMGGIISRYALSQAESINYPLGVSHFMSMDSPQQGAVLDEQFQDYIFGSQGKHAQIPFNTPAAKQMLRYNPFSDAMYNATTFYADINATNGDGYPHLSKNIGISFSNGTPLIEGGRWLSATVYSSNSPIWQWTANQLLSLVGASTDFGMVNSNYTERSILQAGSYLPKTSTMLKGFGNKALNLVTYKYDFIREKDPCFIPYQSALDLRNGITMFDRTIKPVLSNYFHDEFPTEIASQVLSELDLDDNLVLNIANTTQKYGNMTFNSGSVINLNSGTLVVKSPSVVTLAAGSTLNVSGNTTIEVQAGAKLILTGNVNTSYGTNLVIKGGGIIEIANSQTISSGQTWYMNDTIFKFAPSMSLAVNGTLLATNTTLTAQSGTWRGVTMNYGSSAVFDNSKILNVGGCWGCAALSVNSASVTLNNSEIDVPAGGAVSGLYANAYGGSNSVSINNSKIKSASDIAIKAFGLPVHVANSQIVQANGTTALYTTNTTTTLGNDKLKGGKLSAGYNGAILGGLYSGYGSHNHFCDAASSSLEAFSGGYIYANNNYWNNTPTMSGSPIYYNGSMGAPNCTGVSTMQSTASEIARSVQNLRAQALGVGDATTEASLESALSKRGAGKIEEALAELRLVVKSGKMPEAQIALTQIGQIAVQYQKGPEQRGFVQEKLKKSDPLYLTALETSALLDATEGRTDDAIGTLKALANADKGTKGFYAQLNMAQLYRQLGMPQGVYRKQCAASSVTIPPNTNESKRYEFC